MPVERPGEIFSVPENDHRVMDLWERFLNGEEADSNALRRLIDDSWRRCQAASVDPERRTAAPPLGAGSLDALRGDYCELLEAGAPVMAAARDLLSETGTFMVLTDPSGVILSTEGDNITRSAAEDIQLMSGADWSELACGTNAIGTALEIGQPVQIHSAEHYCSGIKRWTCSATVIRNPYDGDVLGVVDVSGLRPSYNRHSLALVVTTAGRIENRLAKIELGARYRLLEHCVDRLSSAGSDGVIVFDRHGRAIKANERAALALADLGTSKAGAIGDGLGHLTLRWTNGQLVPDARPEWLRPEWLEPVVVEGKRIGAVLSIPARRAPSSGLRRPAASTNPVRERPGEGPFGGVIGRSPALIQSLDRARQLARSRVSVLLLGETGVGKEVFARSIHACGTAKDSPFVALNCGGLTRDLLASELFGYAEGAFTGARRGGMIGKIEAADGGTLFLDEIGEMPIDLQPNFLRVLEEGEVYRLGENKPRKINFRLIAATNRDLRSEIPAGRFRMDLFYRIAVTSIRIPPLRERIEDVALLAEHYLALLAREHAVEPRTLSPEVLAVLERYSWPGNIREFRNVMESMLLMSQDPILTERDLPPEILDEVRGDASSGQDGAPALMGLESVERDVILRTIRGCGGNMAAVARELGIAKSTVYLKLKRFGLSGHLEESRTGRF
ncbi:sigma-54-dependent Fis family transcriptional regulator [Thiorhodococcus fuscus]|uniref:Sigma-54-dependent Fis family transcriptional regulator n=1 Tax=Thiorhodococcus fuscus TaxID=527200 RepID=A0ABW4Y2W8_9GAMM